MIFPSFKKKPHRAWWTGTAAAALLGLSALPAGAQDAAPQMMQVDARKLVDQFVEAGVLTREQADRMIANALVPATAATPLVTAGSTPAGEADVQTIPYIPEVVRRQIRDELRAEVTTQARAEGWAAPGQTAEWTQRLSLSGDLRVRGEGIFYADGNDPDILDFGAINRGEPFNINRAVPGSVNPPYLNTLEDRNRALIRARLGLVARLDDWITGEIRLATGNDSSPVSTNQTLGNDGNLDKYQIWLDRGNIQLTPIAGLRVDLGRAENPFWTSQLLFDEDLNFDGVSARYRRGLGDRLTGFGTVGAFPIYNTALDFGSSEENEGPYESRDKWLAAAQAGLTWQTTDTIALTGALGYFNFNDIQGLASRPCLFDQDVCNTDNTRPQFQQTGNTVFPIRTITPDPSVAPGFSPEPQYFGLASEFQVVNLHLQADYTGFDPIRVRLEGDYVRNLGFDEDEIAPLAVNNLRGLDLDNDGEAEVGVFDGGDQGWWVNLTVGHPDIVARGQWRLSAGYRYLESDAVVDGFTDSDFRLGGTNNQGYILGAGYGIGNNTSIVARWLSADEITGQPFSVDQLQIDLNAKF